MSRLTDAGRRLVTYPVGVFGRNRPWYFLNALDALGGSTSAALVPSAYVIRARSLVSYAASVQRRTTNTPVRSDD